MERITFKVELVTPCFLGGADNVNTAEWRAASIRGQLRWWFRAVAGGHFGGRQDVVATAERRLFGSTAQSSAVTIRATGNPKLMAPAGASFGRRLEAREIAQRAGDNTGANLHRLELYARDGRVTGSNPVHYLGYGPIAGGRVARPALDAQRPLGIEAVVRGGLDDTQRTLLEAAVWAWLNLGGIGARCRKGFGSLRCLEVVCVPPRASGPLADPTCASVDAFEERVRKLLVVCARPSGRTSSAGLPTWSHFSSRSKVYLGTVPQRTWSDAMELVGSWLIWFRRRYGIASDQRSLQLLSPPDPATPLAERDYQWAAPKARPPARGSRVPDRAGFGLPLPFGQDGETVVGGADEADGRRASPLLIHIAKFGGDYLPVLTHLPAALVPSGRKLHFKSKPRAPEPPWPEQDGIVSAFLGTLDASQKVIREVR